MSEIRTFLFNEAPVRGAIVRLDAPWQEVLSRRATRGANEAYPAAVIPLLGELTAAAVLLQTHVKFDGKLMLQIQGNGPVSLAVAEAHTDLRLRSTLSIRQDDPILQQAAPSLASLINPDGQSHCAITLEPRQQLPGQQNYQGIVPLTDETGQSLTSISAMLEQYMAQSEQLPTCLVLMANAQTAAGILLQSVPTKGGVAESENSDLAKLPPEERLAKALEDFERLSMLTRSIKADELLHLPVEEVLHRLYWQDPMQLYVPPSGKDTPHFACTCSRERVSNMIRGLGQAEATSIIQTQTHIDVACEFCGMSYRFDAVDTAQLFAESASTTSQQPSTNVPPTRH